MQKRDRVAQNIRIDCLVPLLCAIASAGCAGSRLTRTSTALSPQPSTAHCMFVPTRMDDFAWENDKVAFRVYGPALQKQDGPQSGIDLWQKRTTKLVQPDWYKAGDYHHDHGDGLDGYTVGTARGCGGTAILRGDKLYLGSNFTRYQILENGPTRVHFTLDYPPQDCGGVTVSEHKDITLEAGSQFNKVVSTLTFDGAPIEVAVGVKIHPKGQVLTPTDSAGRFIAEWEPTDGKDNGFTGVAAIVPGDRPVKTIEKDGQLLLVTTVKSGEPFAYLAGGGWSKAGFSDGEAWLAHVRSIAATARP